MRSGLALPNLARLALIAVSVALIVWALVQILGVPRDVAELEVAVENAGLRLRGDEYVVRVSDVGGGALVAESRTSTSDVLLLAPGVYDLRVTVPGVWPPQEMTRLNLSVPGGRRTRARFQFAYGGLELDHTAADPEEVVTVQVFAEPRGATPVIGFVAGETVKLAAGRYDLRVVRTVETREKDVRWLEGIEIEQGRRRRAAVAFERGFLRLDATNAGEPISASDGTVTIFAAGDESQRILETGAVNVPIGLPVGAYDVRVVYDASNDRPVREARGVAVVDDEALSVPVEFNSGDLIVHARTTGGERLGEYDAYTYVYRRDDHRSAIAYVPAGRRLRLSAGRYDVRASLFRSADQPDIWIRDVHVAANEATELETTFRVGDLVLRVVDEEGREQMGDEYTVAIHPAGDRSRAIHRTQVGVRVRLSAGPVELRIENTYTGTAQWLAAEVLAGETTEVLLDTP